jgi:ankyrin repeat protein
VQRLVEAGADVNLYGWPPLIYAAFNGHTAVVEYLLTRGADVNATTETGSTALLLCRPLWTPAVVELLLQNKADPNIANDRGATADRLGAADREYQYRRYPAPGKRPDKGGKGPGKEGKGSGEGGK